MNTYRITFIHPSGHCYRHPNLPDCLYLVTEQAPTKAEAVIQYHTKLGMMSDRTNKNVLPVVYSIEEVEVI